MKVSDKLNRTHLAAAVGAVFSVGFGLLLHEFPIGRGLTRASYDLLMVARGDVRANEAVLVYMDELSYQRLEQPLNAAWDRALHARLIQRLTAAGARAIVFDVVFSDPNPDKAVADELLAKAIKQSGRVILAADYVQDEGANDAKKVIPPFTLVRDAAADMGLDDLSPDSDLVVRQHNPRGDSPLSSLSWAAASFCKAKIITKEKAEDAPRWVNYYGRPNFIPGKSYYESLDPALVPDTYFHDKVVFVGARTQTKLARDRKDEYGNPYTSWLPKNEKQQRVFSAGVEIQSTLFLNLLRGDWLSRMPWNGEIVIIVGLGLIFGYGLIRFPPAWAAAIAVAGLLSTTVVFYLIFSKQLIWFPWLIPLFQIGVALSWSILFNSVQLYVAKRLYEHTLRIYLPPALVKKFSKSRELLKPGAQKQTLTLFFSDIANFTTMSEGMDSDELAALMNHYFETAVGKCVHKAQGTVAKYLGDSIFAFWNAPDPQVDHAVQACEAALLLRANADQLFLGRLLPTRIGLHTGVANVGNFGSEERVDYTALGENVNLASRLEGLNKHLGTFCLISGETKKAIGERLVTRNLGKFQLKGFEGLVDVHELIGRPDQAETSRAWREAFAEALLNYEQRNLEFAEMGFARVLELRPEDGPTKFYLQRIEEMSKQALPDDWVTHTILKEK